jgi:hypothetical protein
LQNFRIGEGAFLRIHMTDPRSSRNAFRASRSGSFVNIMAVFFCARQSS